MTVRIIAHRARPAGLPENSLAGIRKAIEMGADGIEVDVRRSLDSVPVLMHDWSLRRTTGLPGPALLYPLFVLRRLRLQRSAETVPMLAQALDVLSGDAFLALDLKEASAARRVLHLVKERRLERRVLLWTEDADTARLFGREAPETEVNLNRGAHTTGELKQLLLDARSCGARAVSIDELASPETVGLAHDAGMKVYSYAPEFSEVAAKLAAGIDGLVTDQPAEAKAFAATRTD